MLSVIWACLMGAALLFGCIFGRINEVSIGALEGTKQAVQLCLSIAGPLILWSGIGEILSEAGALTKLSRLLSPLLSLVFGKNVLSGVEKQQICANIGANLLGLGNAATPPGLNAAERLGEKRKTRALERFLVLNTASIQLIPTTMAALRSGAGAADPFDICLPVWITSAGALLAAMGALTLLQRWGRA